MTSNPFESDEHIDESGLESPHDDVAALDNLRDDAPALDTSERTFGSVFDNIAALNQEMQSMPAPSEVPMSDLEVTGQSDSGMVEVTIKEAELESIHLDPAWLRSERSTVVEREILTTVNETLTRYNQEVIAGITAATPRMQELTRTIDAVRSQLRGTFDHQMHHVQQGGNPS